MDCIDKFKYVGSMRGLFVGIWLTFVIRDMQNCFRKYPEVYGSELESDAEDEDDDVQLAGDLPAPSSDSSSSPASSAAATDSTPFAPSTQSHASSSSKTLTTQRPTQERESSLAEKGKLSGESSSKPKTTEKSGSGLALVPDTYKPETKNEEPLSESESLVPKAAHDASAAGIEKLERK